MIDIIQLDSMPYKLSGGLFILLALPVLILYFVLRNQDPFPTLVFLSVIGVTLAIAAGIIFSTSLPTMTLSKDSIKIKSGFYSRQVDLEKIDFDGIKIVDLRKDIDYGLSLRTNGISLFSYHLGYYNLKNSGKAFVVLGRPSAIYISTKDDIAFLVSNNELEKTLKQIMTLEKNVI